jgi:hypothetical protein
MDIYLTEGDNRFRNFHPYPVLKEKKKKKKKKRRKGNEGTPEFQFFFLSLPDHPQLSWPREVSASAPLHR